jgi:hypothetical protein
MDKHVGILGVIYIAFGVIGLIVALIVFLAVVGGGWLSGDQEAIIITSSVGTAIAALIVLLSLPSLIAGFGLLKFKSWSRVLALVIGVINLLNIPIGTAIGIYTLWVLLNDQVAALFRTPPAIPPI